MEKRTLIAAVICSVFLVWYMQLIRPKPLPPGTTPPASSSQEQPATSFQRDLSAHLIQQEDVTRIESSDVLLEIGHKSGSIRQATLKKFLNDAKQPLSFGRKLPVVSLIPSNQEIEWKKLSSTSRDIMLGASINGSTYELSYTLHEDVPLVDVRFKQHAANQSIGVVILSAWSKGDAILGHQNQLEAVIKSVSDGQKTRYSKYSASNKEVKLVPRGTSLLSLSERYFCMSIKPEHGTMQTALIPSEEGMIVAESTATLNTLQQGTEYAATVYIGPRDYFYMNKAGFGDAFPIGILGQIGLVLLMSLSWIAKVTKNYGLAIIIFSGVITGLMAPFTIMGFKSMKKLQELKPKVDRIMAQYKGDQAKTNQAIFALYRENRVNPLSGCLPMLLQMPVFIAMFQAISHFIELRGKSFLWISDLSLPDRLAKLPISLPLLGDYLNLLPLVMAVAMYFQTKLSQRGSAAVESNPSMKMMSGPMMPVMFGVMFYQVPSGLVLYWLTNTVLSLVLYKTANT